MTSEIEYIETLIQKEFTGDISPSEQLFLNQVLAESGEAVMIRNNIRARLNSNEVQVAMEDLDNFTLQKGLQQRSSQRRAVIVKITSGIAALLVVALGIYQFRDWKGQDEGKSASVLPTASIQLTTEDGKTIDLSESKGDVQVGNVTLNNNNKKLSYSSDGRPAAGLATLSVPAGRDYNIILADGTEIQLNSASVIQFPFAFDEKRREVTIKGEAYLKVAAKPGQPFIVHLDNGPSVQVLGTEFNLNTYDNHRIRISLVQGSVKVRSATDSVQLKPGFEAAYNLDHRTLVREFDADEVLSWRRGIQEFKDATLAEVFSTFPRWFDVQVVFDNPALQSRLFTGTLDRNKPVDEFLEGLKFTHDVDFYREDGVIHIK